MKEKIIYPENKDFAFTIFDDTDVSTLGNIQPIYDYLYSLGILTTKSVWPLAGNQTNSDFAGSHTLQDRDYTDYIKELSARGYEIAFHGASMESNTREDTLAGLEHFNNILGFYPRSYACHAGNKENMYWGKDRFHYRLFRLLYELLNRKRSTCYSGSKEGSPYYWADICYKHFDYVRIFTYNHINLLNVSQCLPYSAKTLPFVKSCFFTSDVDNVEEFNEFLCVRNQKKLEEKRGVCIVSTHFGKGFVKNGELHQETKALLLKLSRRNGWFVPVCDILNFLKGRKDDNSIGGFDLFMLEFKWFLNSLKRKLKNRKYNKTELDYLKINEA